MYHSLLIHSFADGHLGCFQHLAIVNCAAMNIEVHRFFWIGVSGLLGYNPSSGIAGSKSSFIFSFLRQFHTVFHSGLTSINDQLFLHCIFSVLKFHNDVPWYGSFSMYRARISLLIWKLTYFGFGKFLKLFH